MHFNDILSFVFSVTAGDCSDCFGSSFSAITAAWATKGYWMQAEMIHYLRDTGLGVYAGFIYIIAVGAGLVGYMLGNPPRNYLWYFFGPALFNILLFTTIPSGGVIWQVGLMADGTPDFGDQAEVWKLAEVGLLNMNIKERLGMNVTSTQRPTGGPFDGRVEVAHLFAWTDDLVSDFVQGMIGLLGANFLGDPDGSGADTNINKLGSTVLVPTVQFQKMSSIKWGLLQNITGASIKSPVMAKTLGVFLGSECGDKLTEEIDQANFTGAARTRTGALPDTVFRKAAAGGVQDYAQLKTKLDGMWIATPDALRALYKKENAGNGNSLEKFSNLSQKATDDLAKPETDSISCTQFLSYIVEAMRWESGNAYYQLIDQAPDLIPPNGVVFALYYGWGVRDKNGTKLQASDLKWFTIDLMMTHITKNLFEYTPVSPEQRYSPSEEVVSYIQLQQKTTSSTTKFAEVYSWALMIPYIQGLVLYFLSLAYPVVCVAMIMPGLHKMPITWIKYWFWAKSWDLGFALVQAIERSVWAMMSNGNRSQKAFETVVEMKQWSQGFQFTCSKPNPNNAIASIERGCQVPWTLKDNGAGAGAADTAFKDYIMPVFDKALMLSVNLELDLANSYYIYLMAALYFAVPAVAGQLVGGAGNIASGALDKMTDVKGAAASGYTSDMNQRMAGFAQSFGQEQSFKAQRSNGKGGAGFGAQAIQQANGAWLQGQVAGENDANNAAIGTAQGMADKSTQRAKAQTARDKEVIGAFFGGASAAITGAENAIPAKPGKAAPGGGAPGGAGAAGGGPAGAPAGAGGGFLGGPVGQMLRAAPGVAQALGAGGKAYVDIAAANNNLELDHNNADKQAGFEAQKAANSGAGAIARMNQGRMQADSGRLSRASSFAGAEGKWNAMNDLNTKLGGKLGVIGLNFSPYGAGSRSDDAEGGSYANRMNYSMGGGKIADMASQGSFYSNSGPAAGQVSSFNKALNGPGGAVERAVQNYHTNPTNTGIPAVPGTAAPITAAVDGLLGAGTAKQLGVSAEKEAAWKADSGSNPASVSDKFKGAQGDNDTRQQGAAFAGAVSSK